MIYPLFVEGQHIRQSVLVASAASHDRVLVRTYESANVATTAAAKYNARFADQGLDFYVRRSKGRANEPAAGLYGVYAYSMDEAI